MWCVESSMSEGYVYILSNPSILPILAPALMFNLTNEELKNALERQEKGGLKR